MLDQAFVEAQCRRIGVTRIADLTGLDIIGIPVMQAVRPASKSISVSLGKGLDANAARLSALGEAYELFCAEELVGAVTAWPLGPGPPVEIAAERVSMDLTRLTDENRNAGGLSATGLASHPSARHAVRHGLYECLERHLYSLWVGMPAHSRLALLVDLKTVDDQLCSTLAHRLLDLGFSMLIWDLAKDMAVSSYLVEVFEPQPIAGSLVSYSQGLACAAKPASALRAAILEAIQTRLAYISGAREDLTAYDFFGRLRDMAADRCALQARHRPARRFGACAPGRHGGARLRGVLASLGLGVPLAADLTPPDWPATAVKVILPGALDLLGEERGSTCAAH